MSDYLYAGRIVGKIVVPKDPIIEEVRRVRETEAAKHGFDVKAILAAAKKRQHRGKHKVVSLASRAGARIPRKQN